MPGPAMNWQAGNVAMSEGAGGRTLAPRRRVVWALSARALHGVWQRQEGGLETQVTAQIRGGGAPRTHSQGGVREKMLPGLRSWGLNFRATKGVGRSRKQRRRGDQGRPGIGVGWGARVHLKAKPNRSGGTPGVPALVKPAGGHGVRNTASRRACSAGHRCRLPPSLFSSKLKNTTNNRDEGGKKAPGTPAPETRGAREGGAVE